MLYQLFKSRQMSILIFMLSQNKQNNSHDIRIGWLCGIELFSVWDHLGEGARNIVQWVYKVFALHMANLGPILDTSYDPLRTMSSPL